MALKTKNLHVKNAPIKKVKKEVAHEAPPVVQEKQIEYIDKYNFDNDKVYLVVNGKAKQVSPKSKYMLDMLIIEEE